MVAQGGRGGTEAVHEYDIGTAIAGGAQCVGHLFIAQCARREIARPGNEIIARRQYERMVGKRIVAGERVDQTRKIGESC